ncbi:sugar phosphate nucleotidyltransferase [Aneurinibacillus terranovensis]|uniref:sugar phosphate nucleotidyltransferase n=1 Tax=Aneurinibacillus terranovensis TaxID=278991 RepID=UPI000416B6CE|nr:sugar phosphate nucleotidyltransferase [Aneurinibacillus terranovensis]
MKIVLLSGGSGKRLWPLSNEIRSKIFLKLLPIKNGGRESMIQRVCRQLDSVGLLPSTYIITHKSQMNITKNHVGDRIPIISEPLKRGTFTAVALAITYLHSKIHADPEEMVCVLPVDLFVETDFFEIVGTLPDILVESHADLALLGTTPTHPSNQFGYIVPKSNGGTNYYPVERFVEKPVEGRARSLIKKRALWNCGVFAFPIRFMLSFLRSKGLPVDYEELLAAYEHLPELSFDYEVVEKTPRSVVVPYHKGWNDLGSWSALADYLDSSVIGAGEISDDSQNTHIINELSCPIHVIDVPDIIIAASPDGILIASKKNSSRIKQILDDMEQK